MKQTIMWESVIDDKVYSFSYKKVKGKHIITVNQTEYIVKGSFVSAMLGFDEAFEFDGFQARLVIERGRADVVVNGAYLQSGKRYVTRPTWAVVFGLFNILIPVVSLGGLIPAVLGILGAMACVGVAKSQLPLAVRVVLAVVITAFAWFLWFLLILGMSEMQL